MTRLLLTLSLTAGILAQAWGQSSTVRYDNATKAVTAPIPFRVGQSAVDPTTPGNGSLWYDTATNTLEARINGATVSLGAASIITGLDTQVMFFDGANSPAGDAGLTYNKTSDTLTTGTLVITDAAIDDELNVVGATNTGTLAIAGHPLTLSGALTTSGAFALTLTSTAQTNVTLPTSGVLVSTTTLNNSTLPVAATTLVASDTFLTKTGSAASPAFASSANPTYGAYWGSNAGLVFTVAGANRISFNGGGFGGGINIASTFAYAFAPTTDAAGVPDLLLVRDAAATLQLGVDAATGTNQKLKAMDASAGTGGNLTLAAGTGTTAGGALILQTAATGTLTDRLSISAGGSATFNGGSVTSNGYFNSTGAGGNGGFLFTSGWLKSGATDGISVLTNTGGTTFNRLDFVSSTSASPSLKRVGTEFQVTHAATTAAINVAAVDAEMTFIEDRYRRKGTGSPEGVVTAPISAIYHRTDGGDDTSVYVKISGTGNTGWKAIENVP